MPGSHATVYRPYSDLGSPRSSDHVVTALTTSISLGVLPVGAQLPPEPVLAKEYGVAVTTLRKALSQLRQSGVIETTRGRAGGSTVVRPPEASPAAAQATLADLSVVELRDLGDEHGAVFSAIAYLACARAGDDAVTYLKALIDRLDAATTDTERSQADARFHIELAVACHSKRLWTSEIRMQAETAPLLWAIKTSESMAGSISRDHALILDAIRAQDAREAQELALEHVRNDTYRLIDARLTMGE